MADVDLASTAVRGGAVTLLAQGGRILVGFTSTVVLARLLSPSDFGLVAMAVAVVGVADLLRDFGLSTAAIQAKHLSQTQKSNLFWINALVGGICAAGVFLLAVPIAAFFEQDALIGVVRALAAAFLINGLSTQFKVQITRQLRFGRLACIEFTGPLMGLACGIAVSLLTTSYWVIVVQQISAATTGLVLSVFSARWWPGRPRRCGQMRDLLTFSLDMLGTQLIAYVAKNVDSIAIGRVWGPTQLGIYDRAYQVLVVPLNQLNAPLSRVAIPVFARLSGDDAAFTTAMRKAQLLTSYCTGTIFALSAALAEPIVAVLFGPEWTAVAPVLAILALGGVFRSLMQVCFWIYTSLGLTRAQLKFYLSAQPILIAAVLIGLPWGIVGVAVGHSVGFGIYWILSLWWVGRVSGVDSCRLATDAVRALLLFAAPVGTAAFIGCRLVSGTGLQLVVGGLAAGLAAILAVATIRPVRADIQALVGLARRAVRRSSRTLDGSGDGRAVVAGDGAQR